MLKKKQLSNKQSKNKGNKELGMKIRDLVLLLVGGGLVVFGMVVGDLLENDAFADGHTKTELSELELKQKVKSAEFRIVDLEKELGSARNVSNSVEYEYATLIFDIVVNKDYSSFIYCEMIYQKEVREIPLSHIIYDGGRWKNSSRKPFRTKDDIHHEDHRNDMFDFVEQVLNPLTQEGWFLDKWQRDSGEACLILKRVKQ